VAAANANVPATAVTTLVVAAMAMAHDVCVEKIAAALRKLCWQYCDIDDAGENESKARGAVMATANAIATARSLRVGGLAWQWWCGGNNNGSEDGHNTRQPTQQLLQQHRYFVRLLKSFHLLVRVFKKYLVFKG
jgi:hypothetical protein